MEKKQAKLGLAMKKLANVGLTQSIGMFSRIVGFFWKRRVHASKMRAIVCMFFIHIGRRLIKNLFCTMYFPLKYLETKVALFVQTLR